MSREPQSLSNKTFGFLRGCLVEGDAEQRFRERRIRRRALAISIGLQSAALAALLSVPLVGRTERIALGIVTPVPPYSHHHSPAQTSATQPPRGGPPPACRFCAPASILPIIPTHDPRPTGSGLTDPPGIDIDPTGQDSPDTIPISDSRKAPPPGGDLRERETKRIVVGHLEAALLIRRIEPVYPILARQIGRAGRVELRAIIATNGSMQSLQVIDGDPLFIKSALDAVSQWRYQPTLLNGQPVEVDTHITVIYSLQH